MEENKDIFLAGDDALVYLAEAMHTKYSTTFVWSHPLSTNVSYDRFFNSPPLVRSCTHFGWPPPFLQLRTYLLDGLFLNQKTNHNIRIPYSNDKNINIQKKKKKFLKSHTRPKILHLTSFTISHINGIIIVHLKSYWIQCF